MKNRLIACFLIFLMLTAFLAGCNPENNGETSSTPNLNTDDSSRNDDSYTTSGEERGEVSDVEYTNKDLNSEYSGSSVTKIHLADGATSVEGSGATVSGNTVTITVSGDYLIDGKLTDGQIYVNLAVKSSVRLILNGVEISNSRTAPIYMVNVTKSFITLAEGSVNTFTDAASYFYDNAGDDEPNGCIFSKGDIVINGEGILNVNGRYNNGIQSKDELKIISGIIKVTANNNALKGKDFVAICGGTINLTAGDDGIQSDNTEDTSLGFIQIDGGDITISAGDEGIQAETYVKIKSGTINISCGGDAVKAATVIESESADINITTKSTGTAAASRKGLKAGEGISILSGVYTINSTDDAVHSNGTIVIYDGEFNIQSGDDAVHADNCLTVNGGMITISGSYEGLESKVIEINGGNITIKASDDGINASSGTTGGVRPGAAAAGVLLSLNGGNVYIDSNGDGIDSNGDISVTGGTVICFSATSSADAAFDFDGSCKITDGTLFCCGMSGMAQMPGTSSGQNSVMIGVTVSQGSAFTLKNSSGETVFTVETIKSANNIVFSSPELTNGSYTYTAGSQSKTFTVSSVNTSVDVTGGGMGGGGWGGGGRR